MTVGNGASGSPVRKRVTSADVARASGVSRTTVSYVLNHVPGQTIPEQTRARVEDAARKLGYVPSAAAASLRRGHSRIILLVTDRALTGFITEPFLGAIAERLAAAGYTTLTYQREADETLLSLVHEVRPFGVMALTGMDAETLALISASGVPRIYASSHGDPSFPRPWEEEIGELQAQYLIDRGCTSLAYAAPALGAPRRIIADARVRGVERVCAARGLPAPLTIEIPTDRTRAAAAVSDAMASRTVSGVCAFDDTIAVTIVAAATDLGLTIPGELAVIGVDDAPFAPFTSPPLTTIAIDGSATGAALATRFLSDSYESELSEPSRAQAAIIVRGSA